MNGQLEERHGLYQGSGHQSSPTGAPPRNTRQMQEKNVSFKYPPRPEKTRTLLQQSGKTFLSLQSSCTLSKAWGVKGQPSEGRDDEEMNKVGKQRTSCSPSLLPLQLLA